MKYKMIRMMLVFTVVNFLFAPEVFAAISTRERCELALKMMGVKTVGTERGWASLCEGVVKNDTITRYGKWYGPGYWGGSEDPNKAGLNEPVDSLDAVAMRHDYGYLVAEKYGKIYGKKYEYKLKAMADMVAVRDAMSLSEDPSKWDKVPADIEKASRYRDRIITGFIIESDIYKGLEGATKVGDTITSPFITWFDEIDYSHIPDIKKFDREVSSYINGWKKDVAKKIAQEEKEKQLAEKKKTLEEKKKADAEKKAQQVAEMKKLEQESNEKRKKEALEARERLKKRIAESKKEKEQKPQKKSYSEMTPEERREALKKNDDEAWKAIKEELTGSRTTEDNTQQEDDEEPKPEKNETESDIPPVKLTASGSFDEDYSAKGIPNIVTTTVTLSFWNVGSQVSGYGGVTMKSKSVSSLNGSTSESSCSGTFSGGPNGVIKLGGECDGTTLSVQGGSSIAAGDTVLTISDPSAFSYWNK